MAAIVASVVFLLPKLWARRYILMKAITIRRVVTPIVLLLLLVPVAEEIGFDLNLAMHKSWERVERGLNLEETESFRLAQYRTALNVLKDYPLVGVGFGNLTRRFEHYRDPSTPASSSATTDNMYLMVACETGILGLMAFLALLFCVGRSFYDQYRTTRDADDRELTLAILVMLCGFLANMMTWDALNQPTVRMTFWLLIGIAFGRSPRGENLPDVRAPAASNL